MLSCTACTSKTEKPGRKCMDGSKCTSKNCPFAHASPSGAQHMAGDEPTSCRDGIQCTTRICPFAHPCKGLQCTALHKDSDGHAIKYIMQTLKESPNGSVMALLLGRGIKKEDCSLSAAIRRAGGFKSFCLKHAALIKWVTDRGGGKVELVKDSDGDVIKYIVESLKSGHGVLQAILLSRDINVNTKNCSWPAVIKRSGGLKKFCFDHADKIKWVETSVGGNVELVETKVMPSTPSLESAAHCCCNACTFETTKPAVKCRDGSKCTEKTCPFAHASPSGTVDKAGYKPTSCRDGMQCNTPTCQFAHPSKVWKSRAQDSDGDVIKHIVRRLEECKIGVLPFRWLFSDMNKMDCLWSAAIRRAGGSKKCCLEHYDKFVWEDTPEGGNVSRIKVYVDTNVVAVVGREENVFKENAAAVGREEKEVGTVVGREENAHTLMPDEGRLEYGENSDEIAADRIAASFQELEYSKKSSEIVADGVAAGGGNAVLTPPNLSFESVSPPNGSKLSAETNNFARYIRLMNVVTEVMARIFRASYQKEFENPWTQCSGEFFFHNKFPDGSNSFRQLGCQYADKIKAGKIEEWDISLLSRLLLSMAGYLKGTEHKCAVKTLRRERNILVHDFLPKQSLSENEFEEKWRIASKALNVLTDQLSPAEKSEIDLNIDAIENTWIPLLTQIADSCVNQKEHAPTLPRASRDTPAARTVFTALEGEIEKERETEGDFETMLGHLLE